MTPSSASSKNCWKDKKQSEHVNAMNTRLALAEAHLKIGRQFLWWFNVNASNVSQTWHFRSWFHHAMMIVDDSMRNILLQFDHRRQRFFQIRKIFLGHFLHLWHVIKASQECISQTPENVCAALNKRHIVVECEHTVRHKWPRRHQAHRMIKVIGVAKCRNCNDRRFEFMRKHQPAVMEKLLEHNDVKLMIGAVDEFANVFIIQCMLSTVESDIPCQIQIIQNTVEFHAVEVADWNWTKVQSKSISLNNRALIASFWANSVRRGLERISAKKKRKKRIKSSSLTISDYIVRRINDNFCIIFVRLWTTRVRDNCHLNDLSNIRIELTLVISM